MIARRAFPAMGGQAELLVAAAGPSAAAALHAARAEIARLEALLSRFRPGSELSRLNRDGVLDAGPDLWRVLVRALHAREATGGSFDPTVHDALCAAGYNRDLAAVTSAGDGPVGAPRPGGGGVRLGPGRRVRLAPGVRIDLGGIAKGDAADRACAILAAAGPALASLGGDLAVSGPLPGGVTWAVGTVDGPTLALARGAVATSGVDRRRWRRGGRAQHHVIDPRTGRPADTDLLRVSVVAHSATIAEVWATDLLVRGRRAARRRAVELGLPAVLVPPTGPPEAIGVGA